MPSQGSSSEPLSKKQKEWCWSYTTPVKTHRLKLCLLSSQPTQPSPTSPPQNATLLSSCYSLTYSKEMGSESFSRIWYFPTLGSLGMKAKTTLFPLLSPSYGYVQRYFLGFKNGTHFNTLQKFSKFTLDGTSLALIPRGIRVWYRIITNK
ncbi:hypothetical protein HMI54_014740 [Coelomomyces lativittatus]|nr:hypothetical protein HMI56_000598 [Coelomomyces lativittatus]KAJ1508918.1 hypothetical protein HMI55_000164 [Coelomomyces lativittatus]KAJ1518574.1 hypothetical protein HMI54_014740 [Coelomomyces lativittatus]